MATILARRSIPRILGLLIILGAPSGEGAAQTPQTGKFEFHHDFRGGKLPPELIWFNAEGGKFFHEEAEGLRLTIPATWIHPFGGIGFRTSFGFGGDFEVTAAFEVLQAETPAQGYGVGVCLRVGKSDGGAGLCRLTRKGGREVLLWDRSVQVPEKKSPVVVEGTVPCAETTVRLRLRRSGKTLYYLWAPGTEGGQFEEIQQIEFGDAPIDHVRLAGLTGRQACNLDSRLLELHIVSQASERPAPTLGATSGTGWRLAAVGIVVVAMACVAWLAARRSRGAVHGQ